MDGNEARQIACDIGDVMGQRGEHGDPDGNLEQDLDSPWGLGAQSAPCSASHLSKIFEELVGDGKMWLRDIYYNLRKGVDSTCIGCPVVSDSMPVNLSQAAKFRLRNLTCNEVTPGLCRQEPN